VLFVKPLVNRYGLFQSIGTALFFFISGPQPDLHVPTESLAELDERCCRAE
jgi:hypothetical protein